MQVIAHNLTSQFANRQLKITSTKQKKSAERLASGFRINGASDDAAGLSISEKMRWQIRGLQKGEDNCQAGVSFCQVADGAMTEIEDIIQRMRELSVQSANDTNTDEDRRAIQNEVDALITEVDRITDDTEFNTLKVFGWERKATSYTVDAGGNLVVSGGTSTTVVNGNNYGLGEVLGAGHYYNGTKLDNRLTLSGGGWSATGQVMWDRGTANSVLSWLNRYTNAITSENSLYNTGTSTVYYDDFTNNYRVTVNTRASVKTLDGRNPATEIILEKGQYTIPGDASSFVRERVVGRSGLATSDIGNTVYDNGLPYGSAWLDFSGLGTDYILSDLYGQGFNSTCATCSRHYSISFTGDTCNTTVGGANFTFYAQNNRAPRIEINISGCTTGEDIVNTIMTAVDATSGFVGHFTQYAVNNAERGKLYILDNRNSEADGGRSTFELAYRNERGQLQIGDTIVTDPATGGKIVYTNKELWIQSGEVKDNGFFIVKPMVNTSILGIEGMAVTSFEGASSAIAACDVALDKLNTERSKVGAQQNRLERAVSVDSITGENTQSAESRLRDTDMAEEMVDYARHNILLQTAQSVLAQANQLQQGILSLLS